VCKCVLHGGELAKRTNVVIPDKLKRQAMVKAIAEGKNLSLVIRQLLRLWLDGRVELPGREDADKGE
jgi:Arc/MetJ-type ribon-helix-helix transcriptional regulator